MKKFNEEKMTMLDYNLLKERYSESELEQVLAKIDEDYPVQYAIGNVDFLGCEIDVDERVLIPRFETELLVQELIDYMSKYGFEKVRIVDACTGSGCIAIALAKHFENAEVWGIDKSEDALDVARANAAKNGVEITFLNEDVLEGIKFPCKCDVLVSNPPYVRRDEKVSANTRFEPSMALYPVGDELIFYRRILEDASDKLVARSIIAFEIGSEQGLRVCELVRKFFPDADVRLEQDYAGLDRFVFVFNRI